MHDIRDMERMAKEKARQYTDLDEDPVPREEVIIFSRRMEACLRRNDHKGGWRNESPEWLFAKLIEEVGELAPYFQQLSRAEWNRQGFVNELADVANLCMMLYSVMCNERG